MNKSPANATKQERTQAILDMWRGREDEWSRLHTILCFDHPLDFNDTLAREFMAKIDGSMIAQRMDEIIKELFSRSKAKLLVAES